VKLRILEGPQEPVSVIDGKKVVNLTSNKLPGLANHPSLKKAAKAAIDKYGVGTAAVRTIIGTMDIHMALRRSSPSSRARRRRWCSSRASR